MELATLLPLCREALVLAVALSLPIVAAAAIVGLMVSALQSATSLQDAALAHLPKLLTIALATAIAAPWMARTLAAFATRAFGGG
jgi:type III secretory pathway component EscS